MKTENISVDSGKNLPEKKFSTGGISATVWKNQGITKQGAVSEFKTISLQRRYMDKSGSWKTSTSLRINDIPKAALVLSKAYEYLVLRENNSQNAGQIYEEEMVV